jgi:hypothetical protein
MAEDLRFNVCSRSLTKIMSAVRIVVALAFVAGCQNALRDTVPADIKRQFVDVAQRLSSFPPPYELSEPSVAPPYRNWPKNEPGVSEYQTLIQNNYSIPILLSLLKDHDPKIRTLAAAALAAKGQPRLQQYLGPLLDDQSQTFDEMQLPFSASPFAKTQFLPQTVAAAVLRLVEYPNKATFEQYWTTHANREYCADWFLWQFRHKQFAPLALQDIQSVPSPDREMITLWIGMGGWPLHYDGFPQVEVMAAAKHLGRNRVLAVVRGQPPGSDPDIKPINKGWQPGDQYYVMSRFLLSHAKDLLIPSDADLLLTLEAEERKRNDWHELRYEQSWLIAAARLQPERGDQILDEAERNYLGRADIPLARWAIEGLSSLPKVLRWFYGPNDSEERLATEIVVTQPNEQFNPLVQAILASPQRLSICNEAMYRFAEFAQKNKANFDRQFVDWIYAQPPDPYRGSDYHSRTGVIKMSGVARELVRDPRFSRADMKMLYIVKECLAGSASKLSPEQSAKLDSLMGDIDWNLPLNTPESKLQEMRDLLRKFVGE